jgi:hypothetical protein
MHKLLPVTHIKGHTKLRLDKLLHILGTVRLWSHLKLKIGVFYLQQQLEAALGFSLCRCISPSMISQKDVHSTLAKTKSNL